jgi:hypothetical protein
MTKVAKAVVVIGGRNGEGASSLLSFLRLFFRLTSYCAKYAKVAFPVQFCSISGANRPD